MLTSEEADAIDVRGHLPLRLDQGLYIYFEGVKYGFDFEPTSTFEEVKGTLQAYLRKERNEEICFDLIYQEQALKDQETIAESGIEPQETIVAVKRNP